jgi:uncharacterized membrane protein
MSGLLLYLASAVLLFLGHAVPSAPGVRPALVARLGRPGFIAVHSLVSLLALAAFVVAYLRLEWNAWLYTPPAFAPHLAVVLMPIAFLLVVGRLTTREGGAIYRICRHPGSTGTLLWALLHLQAVGDARRVILFATMAAIALFALVKHEIVHRRGAEGDVIGLVPFAAPVAAIIARRERPALGWWRPALALLAYALLLGLHPQLLGVDPLWWLL